MWLCANMVSLGDVAYALSVGVGVSVGVCACIGFVLLCVRLCAWTPTERILILHPHAAGNTTYQTTEAETHSEQA